MKCPTTDGWLLSFALLLNRLTLGLCFVLASITKFRMGISNFYEKGFKGLTPPWLPDWAAFPYGHAIPFLEMLVGVLFIIGLFGRLTAALAFLMLASFTIALCGKLGISGGTQMPFHPNFYLLAMTFLLAVTGAGRLSVDYCARGCCKKPTEQPKA